MAAAGGSARAQERWLIIAEAPAAMAVSDPHRDWFGGGVLPSAAVYRSIAPWLLLGGRLRTGILMEGDSPAEPLMEKAAGGLASSTLALRTRPLAGGDGAARRGTGLWFEVAAGGALTGDDLRPTAEVGIGYSLAAGAIDIGPSLRYVHLFQPDDAMSPADAGLALLGVELTLLDRRSAPARLPVVARVRPPAPPPAPRPAPPAPPPVVAVAPPADRDGDGNPDDEDTCPDDPEVENGVDDEDGCPDQGSFVVVEDRISLEEQVLFDTMRARVKRRGREVLGDVVTYLRAHPEFERIVIEGHADDRGREEYNLWLSRNRGERVQRALRELGVEMPIDIVPYGEARPAVPGGDEQAWSANRRVEFVLIRRREVSR